MVIAMLRGIFFALTIILLASCATPEEELEPRLSSLGIGQFKKVTLTESGIKSVAGKNVTIRCDNFTLSQEELEAYFKRAKKVRQSDYRHRLDWSPCYVRGEIVLANGRVGKWTINQYKGSMVMMNDAETIYMYCPTCRAEKFDAPETQVE